MDLPITHSFPVYAFVNQKGGCGKTTTAVNLAGALAARGDRVLLIDMDPQAHATLGLGCSPERPTVIDVLNGDATIAQSVVPAPGQLTLLPAEPRLAEFEETAGRTIHPEQRLARALAEAEAEGMVFDHVLVDCSPRADGVLCANALFASTLSFLIIETGAFALQGALQALKVLDEVAENQGRTFEVRVIATMFDRRTKFARELLVALHARFEDALFDTVIRTSVRLREAPALGVPVQVLDATCRAAEDFDALAREVQALVGVQSRDLLTPHAPGRDGTGSGSTDSGSTDSGSINSDGINSDSTHSGGPVSRPLGELDAPLEGRPNPSEDSHAFPS